MKKLVYVMLAVLLMTACSHKVYIPVETVKEVVRVEKDSVRDSVYLRDSIYVDRKGDTVLITKWQTKYVERIHEVYHLDSIRDTIQVPYPVEKIVKVEKPFHWWQSALMWLGGILLALVAFILFRKYGKFILGVF